MSMEKSLKEILDEILDEVEQELDEATTTAGVDGYQTPFAFGAGRKKDKRKEKDVATQAGYSIVESIDEARRSVVHKAVKKGSFPVTLVVVKNGKVLDQELVKTPEAVPAAFNVIQSKHKGATIHIEDKTGKRLFSESVIKEYLSPSDVDSAMKELGIKKIPISSQGERILKGMQKEGFIKKVTNKERLIYFVESLGKEKFGYSTKGKPLSSLVGRYWNDITSDAIFFGGKMAAWNVVTNIKDRLANREEVDSTYYMLKNYFNSFGMDTNRSRVFKSAMFHVDEWLKRNKKIASQIGESINEAKVKRPVNRWLELKNDETMHPHKKMAMGLKELKYQLREVEKFFNWYNKIKTMNELDSQNYWKRTNNHIYTIKEKLINIAKTIQEIEK